MLCPRCRRQVERGARSCRTCGATLSRDAGPLELVLPDGTRLPLLETVTVGRAAENAIQLAHPTVSRRHVQIVVEGDGVWVEDAGSSHGTYLDGRPLGDRTLVAGNARLLVGDVELRLERQRGDAEPGRTIVVRPGATVRVPVVGPSEVDRTAVAYGLRPRARSGWALKRLDSSGAEQGYVLKDLRRDDYVRMSNQDAALFQLLDGASSLPDLVAESERRFGPGGPGRLARLLADLGERGLLEGVEGTRAAAGPRGLLARLARPRERAFAGADSFFDRVYGRGGFLLFTVPALAVAAALAVAGLAAFGALVAGRQGTPFVVARSVGLGGLVFVLGRLLVVALHELAHGLTLASLGRRVGKAGVKLILLFPFAFVDTSESWFEPRRRRLAVSAAGPVSDLAVGGAFALGALALGEGSGQDVVFQLALAAYVGALFNLNPFLDRDGYHILVDLLRQPGLRRHSREHLVRRLAGRGDGEAPTRAVRLYAVAAFAWSLVALAFVIIVSTRYYGQLVSVAPREVVWGVLGALYLLLFVPFLAVVAGPIAERLRRSDPGGTGDRA